MDAFQAPPEPNDDSHAWHLYVLRVNAAALRIYGVASPSELLTLNDRDRFFELRYPDGKMKPMDQGPVHRAMDGEHVREHDVGMWTERQLAALE